MHCQFQVPARGHCYPRAATCRPAERVIRHDERAQQDRTHRIDVVDRLGGVTAQPEGTVCVQCDAVYENLNARTVTTVLVYPANDCIGVELECRNAGDGADCVDIAGAVI